RLLCLCTSVSRRYAPHRVLRSFPTRRSSDLLFVNPGDVIVAEAPSYVGALGVFRAYQAEVAHVPLDEHGLVPEALEETLTRLRRSEEHTSELQSRENLVCRLLLAKQNVTANP